jgi:hypothetical protein
MAASLAIHFRRYQHSAPLNLRIGYPGAANEGGKGGSKSARSSVSSGSAAADIQAIKQAMGKRPAADAAILNSRAAISSVNAATNRARLIVIRPPESPEFGSTLTVGKDLSDSSLRNDLKN